MAWFIYNYPGNPNSPGSYTFVGSSAPTCSGIALCAVNTDVLPETDPPQPDLQKQGVPAAITAAQQGTITPGVTKLRPRS